MRDNQLPLQPGAEYLQGAQAWDAERLFAGPVQDIRLRYGQRLRSLPPLSPLLLQMTHGTRQWLYLERAELARHPFALQALDVFRRQQAALMIAEVSDAV